MKAIELRALTTPLGPQPSTVRGIAFAIADVLLYMSGWVLVVIAPWWPAKVLGVAVTGVAVAMLFALAHDAAHGSLAASRWLNRLLATVCFLPSWYPYTPWIRGHNHLHHGWTNVAEYDYSWRPVPPDRYRSMSAARRAVERVYRSWWGLWLHSIVEIWWKHMLVPRADDRPFLNARLLNADRLLVAISVAAHILICAFVAPRWSTVAGGPPLGAGALVALLVIAPWWIFHVMFSVVTFLHHTHPRVRWYRTRAESSFYAGQVQATVHVAMPTWIEWLLHNITVHGAHHVDPRVPFRNLPDAQRRLKAALNDDVRVERWSMRLFIRTTRTCQLYDYDTHTWTTFRMTHQRKADGAVGRPGRLARHGSVEIVA